MRGNGSRTGNDVTHKESLIDSTFHSTDGFNEVAEQSRVELGRAGQSRAGRGIN